MRCTTRWIPADLAQRITPPHGWCGWSAGFGDAGGSRPACPGGPVPRARRDHRAGQHLGRGLAFVRLTSWATAAATWRWMCRPTPLTKYPSGGGDVLMGSITTRDPALHLRIKLAHMHLGLGVGPMMPRPCCVPCPAWRCATHAHDRVARNLARWMQQQSPWCRCCTRRCGRPGHAHWQALCGQGPGREGAAAGPLQRGVGSRTVRRRRWIAGFATACACSAWSYSWGGPMSQVVPWHDLASMRQRPSTRATGTCGAVFHRPGGQADLRRPAQALHAALGTIEGHKTQEKSRILF